MRPPEPEKVELIIWILVGILAFLVVTATVMHFWG